MIPQFILLALMCLGLGIHLAKDGEPRNDNYSFILATTVAFINLLLLWLGGFFDCFL